MKYQVTVNIDGYHEIISTHKTPGKAIEKMLKAAKETIAECFNNGTEFSAFPTSDSRYPDAWGYANNGYCIKRSKSKTQYEVKEITDKIQITQKIQLIDLGLPSGTLWADRNVGADKPEEYGDYFRFGETTPFTEKSPEYVYNDINESIAGTDKDAATTILGAQFHMPTFKQIKELLDYCSREWTQVNGVNGTIVTGPNGNSIFLPASGLRFYDDGSLFNVGSYGYFWSASPSSSNNSGHGLYFNSSYWDWSYNGHAYGFPVRPVNG